MVFVGIDIGTKKTIVLIVDVLQNKKIIGYGISDSSGVYKGIIKDIEKVSISINEAVKKAEKMSNFKIKKAFVSVDGKHISSLNFKIDVLISKYPKEIKEIDLKKINLILNGKNIGSNNSTIHKIIYNYTIDSNICVKNPLGMIGSKLEADTNLIFGDNNFVDIIDKSLRNLNIKIEEKVFSGLALSKFVLNSIEKKSFTTIIDVGAGKTTISVVYHESVIFNYVIPVGGDNYTLDLVSVLKIDVDYAEKLKQDISNGSTEAIDINSNKIDMFKRVLNSRSEELVEIIYDVLSENKYLFCTRNGIIVTGGASITYGFVNELVKKFICSVRIENSRNFDSELEISSEVCMGLINYGINKKMSVCKDGFFSFFSKIFKRFSREDELL